MQKPGIRGQGLTTNIIFSFLLFIIGDKMDIRKTIIIWITVLMVLSGVIFFVGMGNAGDDVKTQHISSSK